MTTKDILQEIQEDRTRAEFAAWLGVAVPTAYNLLRGSHSPAVETLRKIRQVAPPEMYRRLLVSLELWPAEQRE